MTAPYYERLTSLDASFLAFEETSSHMHLGSVSLFDAKPLRTKAGGLDFAAIESAITQIIPRNPRLRQKVWWPTGGPPVWVDDPNFHVGYHIRHAALPSPGSLDQLKQLSARIMSRTLDAAKPLWENWIVEGIEGDRCAIIAKLHHSLADGISARDILIGYLGLEPGDVPEPIEPFVARPAPSVAQLHLDAALRRAEKARELGGWLKDMLGKPDIGSTLLKSANDLLGAASNMLRDPSPTPLNRPIGPHRRFDFTSSDFGAIREIRKASGAKVNDIVLAVVSGAVRRFLLDRKLRVDDLDFRVMVPVNVRTEEENGTAGNRVSNMTVPLALFETDPRRRLQRVMDSSSRAKRSQQSAIGDMFAQAVDSAGFFLPRSLAGMVSNRVMANMVVTNVPGPQFPQFLLGGEMLSSFPLVPLAPQQALGVALYSYNGVLHWGCNADWDLVPDLSKFVKAIELEMLQLHRAFVPLAIRPRTKLRAVPVAVRPSRPEPVPVESAL